MKIRWTQKSVRFRITPSELAAIECDASISEPIALPSGSWTATIARTAQETSLAFEASELRLSLSDCDARQLGEADREGVYFETNGVRYLIEKDFPCIHPRAADAMEAPTETFTPPPDFEARKTT